MLLTWSNFPHWPKLWVLEPKIGVWLILAPICIKVKDPLTPWTTNNQLRLARLCLFSAKVDLTNFQYWPKLGNLEPKIWVWSMWAPICMKVEGPLTPTNRPDPIQMHQIMLLFTYSWHIQFSILAKVGVSHFWSPRGVSDQHGSQFVSKFKVQLIHLGPLRTRPDAPNYICFLPNTWSWCIQFSIFPKFIVLEPKIRI